MQKHFMNREIKFRIWDSFSGEWITGPCEYLHLSKVFDLNHCLLRGWVCQQYTGLKDVNNKEIYDGDLILGNTFGPYRVFWDNKIGGWCSCCYSDCELISSYKKIEVVGHIFDGTKYDGQQ